MRDYIRWVNSERDRAVSFAKPGIGRSSDQNDAPDCSPLFLSGKRAPGREPPIRDLEPTTISYGVRVRSLLAGMACFRHDGAGCECTRLWIRWKYLYITKRGVRNSGPCKQIIKQARSQGSIYE